MSANRYRVVCSCGHEDAVFLHPWESERKLDWYRREGICTNCYFTTEGRRRLSERRAAHARKAQAKNEALGLPLLEGTPREVEWAECIRARFIPALERYTRKAAKKPPAPLSAAALSELRGSLGLILSEWRACASAACWVDPLRNLPGSAMVEMWALQQIAARDLAPNAMTELEAFAAELPWFRPGEHCAAFRAIERARQAGAA